MKADWSDQIEVYIPHEELKEVSVRLDEFFNRHNGNYTFPDIERTGEWEALENRIRETLQDHICKGNPNYEMVWETCVYDWCHEWYTYLYDHRFDECVGWYKFE